MSRGADFHNELAGKIVSDIIRPIVTEGLEPTAALVLLESVVAGVFLAIVKLGGDEPVLNQFTEGVKIRLGDLRLKLMKPEGSA